MKYSVCILIFLSIINYLRIINAATDCPTTNNFGYCTVLKKHLPKFEVFRPKGLRVTINDTPGLQSISLRANINRPITRNDTGDVHFQFRNKDGKWIGYTENVQLKLADAINYYLSVQENNKELNYAKKRKLVMEIKPSPFNTTPSKPQQIPSANQNKNPTINNNCPCCTIGHSTATATATASGGSHITGGHAHTTTRPASHPHTTAHQKPPAHTTAHQKPPAHTTAHQKPTVHHNTAPQPHTTAHPKPTTRPQPTIKPSENLQIPITNQKCNENPSSENACDPLDIIKIVTKLEIAQSKIDSLTEVLEYLLDETVVKGKKLFYLMSEAPTHDNALDEIKSFLIDNLDLIDLENEIVTATFVNGGIMFEMKRNIDKMRILFRGTKMLINTKNELIDPEAPVFDLSILGGSSTTIKPVEIDSTIDKENNNFDNLADSVFNPTPAGIDNKEPIYSDIDQSFWRIDESEKKN